MSLSVIGNAISQAIYFVIDAFVADGLGAVLVLLTIFVAFVLMWAWTQYLVTEIVQDIREWRQKREAMNDAPNAQRR